MKKKLTATLTSHPTIGIPVRKSTDDQIDLIVTNPDGNIIFYMRIKMKHGVPEIVLWHGNDIEVSSYKENGMNYGRDMDAENLKHKKCTCDPTNKNTDMCPYCLVHVSF